MLQTVVALLLRLTGVDIARGPVGQVAPVPLRHAPGAWARAIEPVAAPQCVHKSLSLHARPRYNPHSL